MRTTQIHPASSGGDQDALTASVPREAWLPFVVAGAVLVLAGGFVSAAGGESPSRHLSWASAYLVLVCGAAQILLGAGQARLAPRLDRKLVVAQLATFEIGNAGVLAGTLSALSGILYAGSAILLVSLALFAWSTRGAKAGARSWLAAYRVFVVALMVSVPTGAALAH